jgi:hypothetical protein
MKRRTITMNFYGPTDVDEVSRSTAMMREINVEGKVSVIQTQRRTVYYGHSLSMLQLYMASDIIDNGMSIHKGVLVGIDPTSDDPYVIEVNGNEESFPFIGIMT